MKKLLFFVLIFLIFFSCKKPEKYSDIPQIKFKEIPVKDTIDFQNHIKRCVLTFSLIDGDGDIGFKDGDTFPPYNYDGEYYNNLWITMYKIVDGKTVIVDTSENKTSYNYRTTYIQPQGQNKSLKCTIFVNLDFNLPSSWDSLQFEFYMYDRALHKSNVETTSIVVL